ncbi:hypothetical protein AMS68_003668 [Peltaster fructicola]|uniref:Zn(2)-C6 fungal-type domain-containing protein n=1 Tax=Peltaster fructicola TaxID=286661 RepID=A0A6H0XU02_9PEZI|nr:hypothetical protein AMS68_003668 [Peltaster fructicola]
MTGRPPSNGCLPCKKRRKRCDLQRPVCTRCIKLRSDCRYTARVWRFVDTTPTAESVALVKSSSPSSTKCLTDDTYVFSAAAIRVQVASHFWDQYLPASLDVKGADMAAKPFFPSYRQMASKDSMLQDALDAIALLCISQQNNDTALLYKGSYMYVQAIRALNNALQQPSRAGSDAVLASCRAIALYEMFRPADENALQRDDWVRHVWGLTSIVALRRQDRNLSDFSRSMHDDAYALAGHCALRIRSPAVLAKFEPLSLAATLQDRITVCMGMAATWLEQHDLLIAAIETQAPNQLVKLNQQCTQLVTEGICALHACRAWEGLACEFLNIDFDGASSPDLQCVALLDAVHSAGCRIWFVVMQYWSVCTVLCSQLHFTWQYLQHTGLGGLPALPKSVLAIPYARCIAASASHLFSSDAGLWTLEQILLPVASAVCYYASMDAGSSWEARQLQKVLSSNKNAVFARGFLRDVKDYAVIEDDEVKQQAMKLKTVAAREWYHLPIDVEEIWLP